MAARPLVLGTLDGYGVEGGFDGQGEPATCYSPAIHLGQCPSPGDGASLWADYESVVDPAAELGLDGLRVSLEWARLEPRRGERDEAALERYRRLLVAARDRGLVVRGCLVDRAWPAWLGAEAWLMPWVRPVLVEHARWVAASLGDLLDGLVVVARPEALADDGYLYGASPPWRRRAAPDARSALQSLEAVVAEIADDPDTGALVRPPSPEVPALADARVLSALMAQHARHGVVCVRGLVAGSGPTAAAAGLLERSGAGFAPTDAGRALASLLRGA